MHVSANIALLGACLSSYVVSVAAYDPCNVSPFNSLKPLNTHKPAQSYCFSRYPGNPNTCTKTSTATKTTWSSTATVTKPTTVTPTISITCTSNGPPITTTITTHTTVTTGTSTTRITTTESRGLEKMRPIKREADNLENEKRQSGNSNNDRLLSSIKRYPYRAVQTACACIKRDCVGTTVTATKFTTKTVTVGSTVSANAVTKCKTTIGATFTSTVNGGTTTVSGVVTDTVTRTVYPTFKLKATDCPNQAGEPNIYLFNSFPVGSDNRKTNMDVLTYNNRGTNEYEVAIFALNGDLQLYNDQDGSGLFNPKYVKSSADPGFLRNEWRNTDRACVCTITNPEYRLNCNCVGSSAKDFFLTQYDSGSVNVASTQPNRDNFSSCPVALRDVVWQ